MKRYCIAEWVGVKTAVFDRTNSPENILQGLTSKWIFRGIYGGERRQRRCSQYSTPASSSQPNARKPSSATPLP